MSDVNTAYLSDSDYDYVYSRAPRLCIDLAVTCPTGDYYLAKRAIEPGAGTWHLSGGRVRYSETITQAIDRISQAELGIKVSQPKFITYLEMFNEKGYIHSVSLVFTVIPDSTNFTLDRQSSDIQAFTSIPNHTHPPHLPALKLLMNH